MKTTAQIRCLVRALTSPTGFFLGILLLGSWPLRTAPDTPTPERSFTTMDLLVDLSSLPPGWKSYTPFIPSTDDFCDGDCAHLSFEAETEALRRRAYQEVFRYANSEIAGEVYEENVVLPGVRPQEWVDAGPNADEFKVSCYDYEGRQPTTCEWVGRYQEYLVFFDTWLIPGYMSLEDMQKVIRAIDARMVHYLGGAPGTREP